MPVTLTTGRPVLKGNAAFGVIDQIYPIGVAKYVSNVGLFTAKNAKWTLTWSSDLIIAANAAKQKGIAIGICRVVHKRTLG